MQYLFPCIAVNTEQSPHRLEPTEMWFYRKGLNIQWCEMKFKEK